MTAATGLRSWWYPIAFASEIGARTGPLAREILGEAVVVWRTDDGIHVARDRCPHRWAKLSAGRVLSDGTLECPYHGWRFDLQGRASLVPQLGPGAAVPSRACLDMLAVREAYGLVWAYPGAGGEPRGGIPELAEWAAPGWRIIPVGTIPYQCAAPVVIDNNLDAGHIAFVHRTSFGAGQDPHIEPATVEPTDFGLRQTGAVAVANRPGDDTTALRTSETEIWPPFVQVTRLCFPDGLVQILFKACCPRHDAATDVFLTVLRNDSDAQASADEIVDFERRVEHEDARVLATVPPQFPLDVTAQVHLRHDRASIELRHLYHRLLAD